MIDLERGVREIFLDAQAIVIAALFERVNKRRANRDAYMRDYLKDWRRLNKAHVRAYQRGLDRREYYAAKKARDPEAWRKSVNERKRRSRERAKQYASASVGY